MADSLWNIDLYSVESLTPFKAVRHQIDSLANLSTTFRYCVGGYCLNINTGTLTITPDDSDPFEPVKQAFRGFVVMKPVTKGSPFKVTGIVPTKTSKSDIKVLTFLNTEDTFSVLRIGNYKACTTKRVTMGAIGRDLIEPVLASDCVSVFEAENVSVAMCPYGYVINRSNGVPVDSYLMVNYYPESDCYDYNLLRFHTASVDLGASSSAVDDEMDHKFSLKTMYSANADATLVPEDDITEFKIEAFENGCIECSKEPLPESVSILAVMGQPIYFSKMFAGAAGLVGSEVGKLVMCEVDSEFCDRLKNTHPLVTIMPRPHQGYTRRQAEDGWTKESGSMNTIPKIFVPICEARHFVRPNEGMDVSIGDDAYDQNVLENHDAESSKASIRWDRRGISIKMFQPCLIRIHCRSKTWVSQTCVVATDSGVIEAEHMLSWADDTPPIDLVGRPVDGGYLLYSATFTTFSDGSTIKSVGSAPKSLKLCTKEGNAIVDLTENPYIIHSEKPPAANPIMSPVVVTRPRKNSFVSSDAFSPSSSILTPTENLSQSQRMSLNQPNQQRTLSQPTVPVEPETILPPLNANGVRMPEGTRALRADPVVPGKVVGLYPSPAWWPTVNVSVPRNVQVLGVEGEANYAITYESSWVYANSTLLKKVTNIMTPVIVRPNMPQLTNGDTLDPKNSKYKSIHRSTNLDTVTVNGVSTTLKGSIQITPSQMFIPQDLKKYRCAADQLYGQGNETELARSRMLHNAGAAMGTELADETSLGDRIIKYKLDDHVFILAIKYEVVGTYDLTAQLPLLLANTNRNYLDIVSVVFKNLIAIQKDYPGLAENIMEVGRLIITMGSEAQTLITKYWPVLKDIVTKIVSEVKKVTDEDLDATLRSSVVEVPRSMSALNAMLVQ